VDASIELPDGWVDRTVLTYVGPDAGEGSPSLVVTRDELTPDITLGRYASMQDAAIRAGSCAGRLPGRTRRVPAAAARPPVG